MVSCVLLVLVLVFLSSRPVERTHGGVGPRVDAATLVVGGGRRLAKDNNAFR